MARRKQLSYEAHNEIAVELKLARRLMISNVTRVGNGLPRGKARNLAKAALNAIDAWRFEMENVMCADHPDKEWRQVWLGNPQDVEALCRLVIAQRKTE